MKSPVYNNVYTIIYMIYYRILNNFICKVLYIFLLIILVQDFDVSIDNANRQVLKLKLNNKTVKEKLLSDFNKN